MIEGILFIRSSLLKLILENTVNTINNYFNTETHYVVTF
jgi:hypothetical protein